MSKFIEQGPSTSLQKRKANVFDALNLSAHLMADAQMFQYPLITCNIAMLKLLSGRGIDQNDILFECAALYNLLRKNDNSKDAPFALEFDGARVMPHDSILASNGQQVYDVLMEVAQDSKSNTREKKSLTMRAFGVESLSVRAVLLLLSEISVNIRHSSDSLIDLTYHNMDTTAKQEEFIGYLLVVKKSIDTLRPKMERMLFEAHSDENVKEFGMHYRTNANGMMWSVASDIINTIMPAVESDITACARNIAVKGGEDSYLDWYLSLEHDNLFLNFH